MYKQNNQLFKKFGYFPLQRPHNDELFLNIISPSEISMVNIKTHETIWNRKLDNLSAELFYETYKFSPDGKILVTYIRSKTNINAYFYIFNVDNIQEPIKLVEGPTCLFINNFEFIDNENIIIVAEPLSYMMTYFKFNLYTKQTTRIKEQTGLNYTDIIPNKNRNYFALICHSKITIVNKDLEQIHEILIVRKDDITISGKDIKTSSECIVLDENNKIGIVFSNSHLIICTTEYIHFYDDMFELVKSIDNKIDNKIEYTPQIEIMAIHPSMKFLIFISNLKIITTLTLDDYQFTCHNTISTNPYKIRGLLSSSGKYLYTISQYKDKDPIIETYEYDDVEELFGDIKNAAKIT